MKLSPVTNTPAVTLYVRAGSLSPYTLVCASAVTVMATAFTVKVLIAVLARKLFCAAKLAHNL